MAKPATRMREIVQESFPQQHAQRLSGARVHRRAPETLSSRASRASRARGDMSQRESSVEATAIVHDTRTELLSAIEEQVIPRLMIAHNLLRSGAPPHALPTAEEVHKLAELCAASDLQSALELALAMLGSGQALETIFLQLIAPAARLLGSDWEDDLRSFTEVTVGLGTLHELVHVLVPPGLMEPSCGSQRHGRTGAPPRGRAVLFGGPGEQHTLGLYIFGELLRHARWSVLIELWMPARDVLQCVRSQPIDAVGLSVSSPERLEAAAELIGNIKRSARKRSIDVLVGGPVDLADETERLGAMFCPDARLGVELLNSRFDAAQPPLPEHARGASR